MVYSDHAPRNPGASVEGHQAGISPFPLVLQVQGGPSPDGRSLLVEAATVEGEMLRFAVALTEVQHLVAFLLVSAARRARGKALQPRLRIPPLP